MALVNLRLVRVHVHAGQAELVMVDFHRHRLEDGAGRTRQAMISRPRWEPSSATKAQASTMA